MDMLGLLGGVAVCLGLATTSCSPTLRKPPTGPVPPDSMVEVPYPPPPGRVETIPHRGRAEEVWIDGQWEWTGEAWRWIDGKWMVPPASAYFTPWTTKRDKDGRLLFAPAAWRGKDGVALGTGSNQETCTAPAPREP